jgi:hypothetical protein
MPLSFSCGGDLMGLTDALIFGPISGSVSDCRGIFPVSQRPTRIGDWKFPGWAGI